MKSTASQRRAPAALVIAALAAACSQGQGVAEEGAEPVLCVLEGESDWSDECRLETARVGGANVYVIRHPDGGFRRLVEREDGFSSADGFEPVRSEVRDGRIFVTVGNEAYNFPARGPQ